MAIAFESLSSFVSSPSAASVTLDWTAGGSSPAGQVLIAFLGFEGVAAGSGPYVTSVTQSGWIYLATAPPSALGNGLEVWFTNGWSSGPTTQFNFGASYAVAARGGIWNGQFVGAGNVIRASATAQVSGSNPAAPDLFAYQGEMIVAAAADQLTAPGYGSPTSPAGYTLQIDNARSGAFGNVEITAADHLAAVTGNTGAIVWTATAVAPATKGATLTLVIRAPTSPAPGFRAQVV